MPIYERSVKSLMADWAKEKLLPGQTFTKSDPVKWFVERYPKVKRPTVEMHVEAMSVNSSFRKHHPNVQPGSGHDLFWKLGPGKFRLWVQGTDPAPKYKTDFELQELENKPQTGDIETEAANGTSEFAYEKDLRNYLAKNLGLIEPGLKLYNDGEEITGIEFDAGGRFIDILAVDRDGNYVVFELKVSRGHDRTVGQLLRYMAWVDKNMDPTSCPTRGIIVAKEITDDLKLAASVVPAIRLIEYELSFRLRPL